MKSANSLASLLLAATLALSGCASSPAPQPPVTKVPPATLPATQPSVSAAPSVPSIPAKAAAPAPAPDYSGERYRLVQADDEIVSMLDNGAVVIVKRVVGSPVLSVRGYVRTGGIYERKWLGAGLSHLLEHLVAGGSNSRRSEADSRSLLQEIGNNSNAYTSADQTAYFINTTPANLDKAADIVTGWMLHALITPAEFTREHEVVQRELEMGRGEPARQFYYMAEANRYKVSPVRVPVIGYLEVIQGLSRDDVYNYYKQAYQPNNMVFAVAGDLPPEQMLQSLRKYLADAPPGRQFDHTIPDEPAVLSPRTIVPTAPKLAEAKVLLSYPTVRLDDPDLYALDLLASVLGGSDATPLVREIRDKQLVSSISAYSATPNYVDGSFAISLDCKPEKMDAAVEAVQVILDRAKREPLDEAAIARARTQMRVNYLRLLQQTEEIASSMAGDYLSTGDVHFTQKYMDRLAAVTAGDLQRVARKYFDNQKLIKTVMLPEEIPGAKGLPGVEAWLRDSGRQLATTDQATTRPSYEVQRSVLDNGTILLVRRVPSSPLIAVRMYSLGGLTAETEAQNGTGNLTMRMLTRGTSFRSAQQIAETLDAMGAMLETGSGNNSWYWNASFLKEDFPKGMELFADVVNNPSFAPTELEPMRKRILAGIAKQDDIWSSQAMRFFRKEFFPAASPYHMQVIGTADVVSRLQPEDLKAWYEQKVLKGRRVLAIYGDIDPQVAQQTARKLLGSGPRVDTTLPELKAPPTQAIDDLRPQASVIKVKVLKSPHPVAGIVIGYEAQNVIGDPANDPLAVANTVAAGWGYPTGYLHETLRGEGLVYVVAAQCWPGRNLNTSGTFLVYAGCAPQKVDEVVDKILLNIARLQGSPEDIQVDWFYRARQLLLTDEAMSRETVSEQASSAALDELLGLGFDFNKTFSDRVNKVKLPDMQNIARQRLRRCVITICTPNPEAVKTTTGLRTYSSFPAVTLTPKGVMHDMPVGGK